MVDPCPACRAVLALPNLLRMGLGMRKPPAKPRAWKPPSYIPPRQAAKDPGMGHVVERCAGVASALLGGGIGAARGPCTRAALWGGAHPPGGQDGGGCAAWYPACMATTRMQNAHPDMWQEVTAQNRSRPVSDTTILPLIYVRFYQQFCDGALVPLAYVLVRIVHLYRDLLPLLPA